MTQVWEKDVTRLVDEQSFSWALPCGWRILGLHLEQGKARLFALVDPGRMKLDVLFTWVDSRSDQMTTIEGIPVDLVDRYVGAVLVGDVMKHLFFWLDKP